MKYKYTLFCPYFGKLPINFKLWLKSCSYNKIFKFIIITDDTTKYNLPENVKVILQTFEEFRTFVQSKFDFKISLNTPYKLCDFKPVYGYIFSDNIDSDYWGFCDIDLIFGDLEKFLPDKEYDKISYLGHFCLMKNNKKMREIFKTETNEKINYKHILSSNVHYGFDEIGKYGINNILKENGYEIFEYEKSVADIDCTRPGLNIVEGNNGKYKSKKGMRVFEFNNGKIFGHNLCKGEIITTEYSYIHFQKRKMTNNINTKDYSKFLIKHHSFGNYEKIDKSLIENNQPNRKIINTLWFKFKLKAIRKRIIKIKDMIRIKKNK